MIRQISATLFFFLRWIPFTGRAFTLLAVLTFFFVGPIRFQSDVILSVVTFCLGALLLTIWLLTLWGFYRTSRSLSITLAAQPTTKPDPETPAQALIASEETILEVELLNARLLPFFTLEIDLNWKPNLVERPSFILNSMWKSPRTFAKHPIVIPHRGIWAIDSMRATLTGPLKLTRIRWKIRNKSSYFWKTALRLPYNMSLPLLASSNEPGGDVMDSNNRLGDYYDLKPYHPSDGMSRVVWKILAKSGQLISRQPEPTSTPEGELLMFLVARPNDDNIAAIALKYLISAQLNNIAFRFGCLGMQKLEASSSIEMAYSLIIESAMKASLGSMESEYSLFTTSALALKRYDSINIFCSEELFAEESLLEPLRHLAMLSKNQNLTPVFFIPLQTNLAPMTNRRPSTLDNLATRYKLIAPPKLSPHQVDPILLQSFERECFAKGWGIRTDRGVA